MTYSSFHWPIWKRFPNTKLHDMALTSDKPTQYGQFKKIGYEARIVDMQHNVGSATHAISVLYNFVKKTLRCVCIRLFSNIRRTSDQNMWLVIQTVHSKIEHNMHPIGITMVINMRLGSYPSHTHWNRYWNARDYVNYLDILETRKSERRNSDIIKTTMFGEGVNWGHS